MFYSYWVLKTSLNSIIFNFPLCFADITCMFSSSKKDIQHMLIWGFTLKFTLDQQKFQLQYLFYKMLTDQIQKCTFYVLYNCFIVVLLPALGMKGLHALSLC